MYGLNFGPVLRQYLVVIAANMAYFQLGLGFASLSPMVAKLSALNQTVLPHPIAKSEGAWIISIGFLTGCISLYLVIFMADRFGRKTTIILCCFPRVAVTIFLIFADRFWMLLVARGVIGFADCVLTITPIYISEIASKEIRGSLGTTSPLLSSLGSTIMITIGPFLSYNSLQIMHATTVAITSIPLLFLPESPYYLYSQGQQEKSIQILNTIRKTETSVKEELHEYTYRETNIKWRKVLTDKISLKLFVITSIIAFGSQATGYNAILTNIQSIFQVTHTVLKSEIASAIAGAIQLIACMLSITLIERFGRKPLMIVSLIGMSVGMAGVGTFFKIIESEEVHGMWNYLQIVAFFFIILCNNFGLGVVWVLLSELFDGPLRATGVSFAAIMASFSSFLTTTYFPSLLTDLGSAWTYWMFGTNCVLTALFVAVTVPETKGKPFSQIQIELGREVDWKA